MFKFRPQLVSLLATCYLLLSLAGCATVNRTLAPKPPISMPGFYHRMEKGQTLWRLSKIYTVDLDEIAKINRISDATAIEVGQLIFVPVKERKKYHAEQYSAEEFIWPVRGKVIAGFGSTFNDMINKGLNIQKHKGSNVVASRTGRIVFYNNNFKGFGKTIIIDHQDGLFTVYAKNSEVFIKTGDYVQKGDVIAKISAQGQDKNAYLHFEIRKGHIPQNPYFYLTNGKG